MIGELRIKCPACGVVLDVKNSKGEAIKRIVCPSCGTALSVDFQEKKQTAQFSEPLGKLYYGQLPIELKEGINKIPLPNFEVVELNVLRTNGGIIKCIVRPLTPESRVQINGTVLDIADKIILSVGDEVSVGSTTLRYGKPIESAHNTIMPEPIPNKPNRNLKRGLVFGCMALLIVAFFIAVLWPNKKQDAVPISVELTSLEPIERTDNHSIKKKEHKERTTKSDNYVPSKPSLQESSSAHSVQSMTEYELERQAAQGNVEAQFELGRQWVRKGDSVNIVKGIKYLKLAVCNGSEKASNALKTIYHTLEQKAANGNIVAANILTEQR